MTSAGTAAVPSLDFMAVDVETANSDLSSICQIGIASFAAGVLGETWNSLVNPEDDFDPMNILIHGIDDDAVEGAPTWTQVYPQVSAMLSGAIVVSHTAFDRAALSKACEKNGLRSCVGQWLDSARVVRRAWPRFSRSGYGLSNVAKSLGIEFQSHDALEDARCAGEIVLRAIKETHLDIPAWLRRVKEPIEGHPIAQSGNTEGPLHGEILVFTGALEMSRYQAAAAAAKAGCDVAEGVTRHTTILVVGEQDARKLAGHDTSSKYRKAKDLISNGQHIRILSENDFMRIVNMAASP